MTRRSRRIAWLLPVGAVTLVALSAVANKTPRDAIVASIRAALAAVQKSDAPRAVANLETALHLAREEAPLEIRRAEVVHAPHTGLGVFDPAPNHAVLDGMLRLYVEVANFGHRPLTRATSDPWQVELEVKGLFFSEGEPIGERALGTHSFVTRTKSGVTSFGVEATLGQNAPAGSYEAEVHVRDATTDKRASRRVKFVVPRRDGP